MRGLLRRPHSYHEGDASYVDALVHRHPARVASPRSTLGGLSLPAYPRIGVVCRVRFLCAAVGVALNGRPPAVVAGARNPMTGGHRQQEGSSSELTIQVSDEILERGCTSKQGA